MTTIGVQCPACGTEYDAELCDGDGDLVTYWGDGSSVVVYCSNDDCGVEFAISEMVVRTWSLAVPVLADL